MPPTQNAKARGHHRLSGLGGLGRGDLLAILVVANTRGRSTVAAALAGADTKGNSVSETSSASWGAGQLMAEVRPRFFSATRVAEKADAVVPAMRTNVPDNLAVDSARDAVLQLEVHLGNRVLGEHGGIRDITWRDPVSAYWTVAKGSGGAMVAIGWQVFRIRTDSRRLDHVADGEPLDGLILGGASRAVGAPDGLDVAAAWEIIESAIVQFEEHWTAMRCSPFLLRPLFFLFLTILPVS